MITFRWDGKAAIAGARAKSWDRVSNIRVKMGRLKYTMPAPAPAAKRPRYGLLHPCWDDSIEDAQRVNRQDWEPPDARAGQGAGMYLTR